MAAILFPVKHSLVGRKRRQFPASGFENPLVAHCRQPWLFQTMAISKESQEGENQDHGSVVLDLDCGDVVD